MNTSPLNPERYPVSKLTGGFTRELAKPWKWRFTHNNNLYKITLPEGTRYNPSIPGIGLALIAASYLEIPSLVHDPIYKAQGIGVGKMIRKYDLETNTWEPISSVTRGFADKMFYTMMEATGVPKWKRVIAQTGIFIGGFFAWNLD